MAATEEQLEQFMSAPGPVAAIASEAEWVRSLFAAKGGVWRLSGGETSELECKREVDTRKLDPVVRTIAGMANNRGGLILLGVENKSGLVVGLPDMKFADLDLVKISSAVRAHLHPTPIFRKGVVDVAGLQVGFVFVEPSPDKPVAVYRPGDRMEDGDVFFRYPAETCRIKFGDLRTLLDERDARRVGELARLVGRVAEIGLDNSVILNTAAGTAEIADRPPLFVDPSLLEQIKFIKEGEFDERTGAPTLKVIGTAASSARGLGRRVITDEDVVRNFLEQETVFEPLEYIRYSVGGTARHWLPLFYFAARAGLDRPGLALFVDGLSTTKALRKVDVLARASGGRSAFAKHVGGPSKRLAGLLAGDLTPPPDTATATRLALAIQGLPEEDGPALGELLVLLGDCAPLLRDTPNVSHLYRAVARVDEVHFSPLLDAVGEA